ncbi:MAG: DNA-binding protein HU [Elusimicrobia bacterium ADurb.Bin231]|nr:MAG: DNA-binding protein HU [Elusimicrobia bacterium ADurb.Bin231]
MDKKEIIEALAKKTCCKKEAADAFEELLRTIKISLLKGEKVHLKGIGALYVKMRKERRVRNPKTKEIIKIRSKKVIRFKPSEIPLDDVYKNTLNE